jgi:hypothetical protein
LYSKDACNGGLECNFITVRASFGTEMYGVPGTNKLAFCKIVFWGAYNFQKATRVLLL